MYLAIPVDSIADLESMGAPLVRRARQLHFAEDDDDEDDFPSRYIINAPLVAREVSIIISRVR